MLLYAFKSASHISRMFLYQQLCKPGVKSFSSPALVREYISLWALLFQTLKNNSKSIVFQPRDPEPTVCAVATGDVQLSTVQGHSGWISGSKWAVTLAKRAESARNGFSHNAPRLYPLCVPFIRAYTNADPRTWGHQKLREARLTSVWPQSSGPISCLIRPSSPTSDLTDALDALSHAQCRHTYGSNKAPLSSPHTQVTELKATSWNIAAWSW